VAVSVDDRPLDPRAHYRYASHRDAGDPDLINRIPVRNVHVLKEPDGSPMDATEVVADYLQSLPEQTAAPELNRVHLTAPLPTPQFGFPEMQPLKGAFIPGITEPELHIDIPVDLKGAKAVFNVEKADLDGDTPRGIKFMGKLVKFFQGKGARYRVVGIFKGDGLYLLLNDRNYNRVRHVRTGNPYRELLAELQRNGVEIEACGNSMLTQHYGNADLLPGVQVNEGAMSRTVQLVQDGFVQIDP